MDAGLQHVLFILAVFVLIDGAIAWHAWSKPDVIGALVCGAIAAMFGYLCAWVRREREG
jgi:hypothetical protein